MQCQLLCFKTRQTCKEQAYLHTAWYSQGTWDKQSFLRLASPHSLQGWKPRLNLSGYKGKNKSWKAAEHGTLPSY
jgi:hypothetical protein